MCDGISWEHIEVVRILGHLLVAEDILKNGDERVLIVDKVLLQVLALSREVNLLNHTAGAQLHTRCLFVSNLARLVHQRNTITLGHLGSTPACCSKVGAVLVVFLVLLLLTLLNAVKEEVLDLGLLCIIERLIVSQLLVTFLHGLDLLLKDQNVHVSRAIISVEELEDALHGVLLGQIAAQEKVADECLHLVIGRVNTELFKLTLSLG